MVGIEVSIVDGSTGVEVVLSVTGPPERASMSADQARVLARQLLGAATAADKVASERILRRHRRALGFEV